ncbi:MAG TPA: FG-GAP-like repeat-containing protein [Bacteroidota bacterium]|nr:FG-GAP-like repeat-containing protein [Bacteroidota bacterium]
MKKIFSIVYLIVIFGAATAHAQSFIASMTPSPNAQNVRPSSNIVISFTTDINPGTLTQSTVKVNGSLSGPHALKSLSYTGMTRSVVIDPTTDFSAGETVTIVVTSGVQNILGDAMTSPFTSQFTVAAKVGSGMLLQTGIPGTGNQPWAAATVDFDHDGAFDFLVLNRASKTVSLVRNYGSGNFLQTSSTAVGTSPSSMAVADFDGDDTVDCAVANEGSNTVSVLTMIDSKGVFTKTVTLTAPGAPSAIVAADIDHDGDMDLIVAGRTSNSVMIFTNSGAGAFTLSSTIPVGVGPSALVTGDFNGDDMMDIAVVSEAANTLTILINNGSGTFTAQTPIQVPAGPVSLATGDFDNDGSIDIVAACKTSNSIAIFRNDGTGTFYSGGILATASTPSTVAAGDMDGDGNCDIVALGLGVTVYHNQGYFQFSALAPVIGGTSPHGLVLADLDGDGDLDCAAPNSASSSLSLFTNRPAVGVNVVPASLDFGVSRSGASIRKTVSIHNDGVLVPLNIMSITSSNPAAFSAEAPTGLILPLDSVSIPVTFKPSEVRSYTDSLTLVTNDPVRPLVKIPLKAIGGLAVLSTLPAPGGVTNLVTPFVTASFNGALDAASLRSSTLRLFGDISGLRSADYGLNNTEHKVTLTPSQKFLTGEHVTVVATDSVTATSPQIRLADGFAWMFTIAPSLGSEFYTVSGSFATGASPYAVATGDFNGDGFTDIAVVNSGDNSISVMMNDTHGGLSGQTVYPLGSLPQALVVADLNEDGAPDIAAVNTLGGSISILLNTHLGDGTFTAGPVVALNPGCEPRAIVSADMNNDGHLDLITANTKDNSISILTNDGTAHFTVSKTITVGASPRGIAAGDFNNDGATDLVVMNRGASTVTLLINTHGSFTQTTYPSGNAPAAITVNDFNHDGFADCATANSGSKDLSVFLNNKNGGFLPASPVQMNNVPTALYSGDMSGDGNADLVVAQYSSSSEINTVQVMTNSGTGAFVRGDSVIVNSPVAVTAFDLSNRGVLNLAVPNLLTNHITVINPAAAQTPVLVSPLHETVSLKPPVTLQWQPTSRTIVYHVQAMDSATGALVANDSSATAQQILISGLSYLTTYKWRVRAKNDIGWGEFSPWWNFTTCVAPPPAPVLTAPAANAIEQEAAPLFTWRPAASAERYRIQASSDPLFTQTVFDTSTPDTLWQSPMLSIHAQYYWRVQASNFGGDSPWSEASSFVTRLPLPEKVQLNAPGNEARSLSATIRFTWHSAQWEVNKYWFEIAADTLFIFRIIDSTVTDTSWVMPKLSDNQRYFWKVRAWNEKGWGPFSETFTFSLGTTGVEADKNVIPDHFALEQNFPNPFNPSTQIRFSIAAASSVQLKVYDILGREVATLVHETLRPGVYTVPWNASSLPSGIYIYRLNAGNFVSTKKLSLQK